MTECARCTALALRLHERTDELLVCSIQLRQERDLTSTLMKQLREVERPDGMDAVVDERDFLRKYVMELKGVMSCAIAAIEHVNLGGAKTMLQEALTGGKGEG